MNWIKINQVGEVSYHGLIRASELFDLQPQVAGEDNYSEPFLNTWGQKTWELRKGERKKTLLSVEEDMLHRSILGIDAWLALLLAPRLKSRYGSSVDVLAERHFSHRGESTTTAKLRQVWDKGRPWELHPKKSRKYISYDESIKYSRAWLAAMHSTITEHLNLQLATRSPGAPNFLDTAIDNTVRRLIRGQETQELGHRKIGEDCHTTKVETWKMLRSRKLKDIIWGMTSTIVAMEAHT